MNKDGRANYSKTQSSIFEETRILLNNETCITITEQVSFNPPPTIIIGWIYLSEKQTNKCQNNL